MTIAFSISVGWCTSEPAKRASPECSHVHDRLGFAAGRGSSAALGDVERAHDRDADLHVAEARGERAVRDVRALARLALAAVRQPVQPPGVRSGDRVERAPELRRDAGVRRVAQHAPELAVLDLPRDLRAELEVEPLVVDRPAAVRLHVDAVVDVGDQVVERPLARLEVEVRHADERHPVPAVRAHRAAGAGAEPRRRLARGEEAA